MNGTVVYALLNKKIKGLTSGIQSASISGTTITFTMNDGSTQNMVFPNPKSGASITDVNIKEISNEYHLICTITDADGNETEIDAGIIPNAKVQIASKTTAGIIKVGKNLDIKSDGTLSAFKSSDTKPTSTSSVGDIVLNSLPNPNEYIGWVYTPLGWFGFGKIESLENEGAFITADNYKIQTIDGDIFCYKTT